MQHNIKCDVDTNVMKFLSCVYYDNYLAYQLLVIHIISKPQIHIVQIRQHLQQKI